MSVQVRIPPVLRQHTGGERVVEASGATVGDVLQALGTRYPGLAAAIYDEGGALRPFLNVYLNEEDVRYLGQQETPVADGDTIALLPALAGGTSVGALGGQPCRRAALAPRPALVGIGPA